MTVPSASARPPIEDTDGQPNYDDAELEASGYRREMPRQFSTFSLLALSYAVICTWNGFARLASQISGSPDILQ